MDNTSLTLVGSGIKFVSHITVETRAYIEQSDKVLYLVNEPAMKEWLKKQNKHAESLDDLYQKFPLRLHCYRAITEYILETVRKGGHICVVLYGHPSVFAQPGLEAVIQAKAEGIDARILPAISAEDCLFADLLIDPGRFGCQSFEATDFLIHHRTWDPTSHLILWQVGVIGVTGRAPDDYDNSKAAQVLVDYLLAHYPKTHEVILYEASQYPHFDPKIIKVALQDLATADYSRISTLYVPPAAKAKCDQAMLQSLGIDLNECK